MWRQKQCKKNVLKESKSEKASKPGELLYLNLSKVTVSKEDGMEFESVLGRSGVILQPVRVVWSSILVSF